MSGPRTLGSEWGDPMAVAKAAVFPNSVLRTHPLQYPRRPPQVQQPVPGRLRAILWRRAPVNAGHSLKLQAFELVRGWIAWKSDRIDRPTDRKSTRLNSSH